MKRATLNKPKLISENGDAIEKLLNEVNDPKQFAVVRTGHELPIQRPIEILDVSMATTKDIGETIIAAYVNGSGLKFPDEISEENFYLRMQTNTDDYNFFRSLKELFHSVKNCGKRLMVTLKRAHRVGHENDLPVFVFHVVQPLNVFCYEELPIKSH